MLGLEPTFDCLAWARKEPPCASCYICHMRVVGAALRRVLRVDGVLWWNQGDSYAGSGSKVEDREMTEALESREARLEIRNDEAGIYGRPNWSLKGNERTKSVPSSLKPGDLIDQSGRIANALQADGWVWKGRIPLAKRNPMPESTDDRPTRSHEFFLFFAKATANTYWTHRDGRGAREQPETDYRWVREIENVTSAPTANRKFRQTRDSERGVLSSASRPPREIQSPDRVEELPSPPPEWQAWYEDKVDKRPEKATGWRRVNLWTGHPVLL